MIAPLLLIAVAVVSAAGTWAARAYALRRALVDEPGARRSHTVATPRGGGFGPVVAMLAALAFLRPTGWAGAAVGLSAVAAIGAFDDHRPLPAWIRLVVHLVAGVALAASQFDPARAPVAFAGTVVATVALINVWNFMDGIDGIAASQAALVGVAAASVGHVPAAVGAAVAAVCIGFLPFNFPKARIFLGDVGSGALGFALAALACAVFRHSPVDAERLLWPMSAFLVDAGLTLARRVLRRERWWEAHAQHLYQGLARRHGHPRVTLAYAAWTAVSIALGAWAGPRGLITASLFMWYTTATALWWWLQRRLADGRGTHLERDR